jgi:hypothetical protein
MPHSKSESLLGLSERADRAAELGEESASIRKFTLRFLDNAWIDAGEKAKMIERWAAQGEDVLRMRSEGEFVTDSIAVYPTFNMTVHGYDRAALPNLRVPADWTRYAAIDPGHAVTAVLFGAVPPDGSMLLVYDELYIRQCNARIFGERFEQACKGQDFHSFVIDMHGARLRDIGSGRQVVEQYMEELRLRGVRSFTTGTGFMAGCDDILSRTSAVRTALHIRPDGKTRLRVLRNACPNLERELRRYRNKIEYANGLSVVTDRPNTKGEVHACQCLEYLVASEPRYVTRQKKAEENPPPQWMIDFLKRRGKGKQEFVYLGPQSDLSSEEMKDGIPEWL